MLKIPNGNQRSTTRRLQEAVSLQGPWHERAKDWAAKELVDAVETSAMARVAGQAATDAKKQAAALEQQDAATVLAGHVNPSCSVSSTHPTKGKSKGTPAQAAPP